MAKLTRESKLRERRLDKQARKEARKLAPAQDRSDDGLDATSIESAVIAAGQPAPAIAVQAHADA